jgi:polysaccharide biosynthesis protein PelA
VTESVHEVSAASAGVPAGLSPRPGAHAPYEAGWARPGVTSAYQPTRPGAQTVWGLPEGRSLAVVRPDGAVAVGLDALREVNPLSFKLRWRVDPFWLFGTLLRAPGEPALDATTLNGRRLFYAHIDGDGFTNMAVRRERRLSAEVVRDELLKRTTLPTTVSVVAGEIAGKPEREAIARSLFALPHVQAGSHSYNHPQDWARGTVTLNVHGDMGGSEAAERVSADVTPQREIDDSVRYIQGLLPPGKRVTIMLWSGGTNPTAAYLERVAALGLSNMNGGDAVLDRRFPSYANIAPLARQVGPHVQVYTSAANENLFTNLWTGPFDGQVEALKLFRFTESPRRVAPVNIYYHFYAGERLAGLKALQTLYGWAEAQPLAHVTADAYARLVQGWHTARVAADGSGVWTVSHAGSCRTLRFDGERRSPDLQASRGVAGFNRANGALYVHLSAPEARVVLTSAVPARPYLHEASAPLTIWRVSARSLSAGFQSEAPATVVLAGFGKHQAVKVAGVSGPGRADAAGRLTLKAPRGRIALEATW